ncbi:MAG: hypothetical protein OIF32_12860 [Campylobacterales bacterium]|nr:hypothetical protein [Campylobacterales bacterium]
MSTVIRIFLFIAIVSVFFYNTKESYITDYGKFITIVEDALQRQQNLLFQINQDIKEEEDRIFQLKKKKKKLELEKENYHTLLKGKNTKKETLLINRKLRVVDRKLYTIENSSINYHQKKYNRYLEKKDRLIIGLEKNQIKLLRFKRTEIRWKDISKTLLFFLFVYFGILYTIEILRINRRFKDPKNQEPLNVTPPHERFTENNLWHSLTNYSTNMATKQVVQIEKNILAIRPTGVITYFVLFFFTMGFISFFIDLIGKFYRSTVLEGVELSSLNFSDSLNVILNFNFYELNFSALIFVVVSLVLRVILYGKRIIFDGEKKELKIDNKTTVSFSQMKALQVIESIGGGYGNGIYTNYELNLILENKERIHLMKIGNGHALSHDTNKLSKFLNLPIWYGKY